MRSFFEWCVVSWHSKDDVFLSTIPDWKVMTSPSESGKFNVAYIGWNICEINLENRN